MLSLILSIALLIAIFIPSILLILMSLKMTLSELKYRSVVFGALYCDFRLESKLELIAFPLYMLRRFLFAVTAVLLIP